MMHKVELRGKSGRIKQDRYWHDALAAMTKLDRADFVPSDQRISAYRDTPLPIGFEQTISDPFVVAVMTSLLRIEKSDRILEIGTGSGYQAAVLAGLALDVRTVEIVEPLAQRASETLARLCFDNVTVRAGDGYDGWPDGAPYDAIIVTAGTPRIPQPLLDQLKPGGRMVIPVGKGFWDEQLFLVTKSRKNKVTQKSIGPVMFVDFTGKVRGQPQR
ncbi:protein-L-isoaspartate(D-aspartate) O-methyltransferase [Sphingorhabdus buctiana]